MSVMNRYTSEAYQSSHYAREDVDVEGSEPIAAADQASTVVANDAALDEVYRLQDNADSMAQTADFIDDNINAGDGEASVAEVGLAEQVADLATAGTGDTAEQVMPASESYVGSKLATEGFRETVRNIIAAIKRMLKNVFERLKKFWKKMFGRCKPLISDAQKLAARAKGAGSKSAKEKTVEISGIHADKLVIDKKPLKSMSDVLKHLKSNGELLTGDIYKKGLDANVKLGESLADVLSDIDGTTDSVDDGLKKLVSTCATHYGNFVESVSRTISSDKRFDTKDFKVKCSEEILGGKRIFIQQATSTTGNTLDVARNMVRARVYFADAHRDQPTVDSVEFTIPPLSTIEDVAAYIEDLATEVHRFDTGKGFRDQERARDRVEKAAEKLGNRKVDDEDRANGLATKLRTAGQFATLYVAMATTPFTPMADHMCSVMRSVLAVGNKCVGEYSSSAD